MLAPPFADALRHGRALFNKRVSEAQRRFPGFDCAALSAFVQTSANAVVAAVPSAHAAALAQVVFDLGVELTGHALAHDPLIQRAWSVIPAQYEAVLVGQPRAFLGLLTNAVVQLSKQSGARPQQWIDEMARLGPRVNTFAQYRALGQLLAWRAGLAHFRVGALEAARHLPDALALAAFPDMSSDDWPQLRASLLADPWHGAPGAAAGLQVGAFTGFGGDFTLPPVAHACEHGFWIRSAQRCFLLIADRYGAILHGASVEEFDSEPYQAPQGQVTVQANQLHVNGRRLDIDEPANAISWALNAHTLVVSSPYSYALRLFPLR